MSFLSKPWAYIKSIFTADVEPTLGAFLHQFATDEGKFILTTAISTAPALLTGNFSVVAAQVFTEVVSKSAAIAAQDAVVTLQQVQSALQIAKAAANIQTPHDQEIAATLLPATPVSAVETPPAA